MLIDGLQVPLTTPFTRDGRLFLRKLEHNVRRYSLSPAAGLVALEPRSEACALTDIEVHDSLHAISEAAAPEKVLTAAIVRNSVAQALALATLAQQARFDAVLLAAPPRWPEMFRRSGSTEILNFFRTVADNSPLPVLLWSETTTPWLGLSADTVASLASHRNVIGLIDADLTPERLSTLKQATSTKQQEATVTTTFRPVTGRMLQPSASESGGNGLLSAASLTTGLATATPTAPSIPALKTRTRRFGFQILSAAPAHTMLDLLQAGASGVMPTLAAPAPQSCHEVLAAFGDGDPALAAERAARLKVADEVVHRLGNAAVHYACDLNAYYGGLPRLPLLPLTSDERTQVDGAFHDLRN